MEREGHISGDAGRELDGLVYLGDGPRHPVARIRIEFPGLYDLAGSIGQDKFGITWVLGRGKAVVTHVENDAEVLSGNRFL